MQEQDTIPGTVASDIDTLYESWLNGNRVDVVQELLSRSTREAMLSTAALITRLNARDRQTFGRLTATVKACRVVPCDW